MWLKSSSHKNIAKFQIKNLEILRLNRRSCVLCRAIIDFLKKSGTFKVLVHFDGFLKSNFSGQQRKSVNSAWTDHKNPGQSRKNPSKLSAYSCVTLKQNFHI